MRCTGAHGEALPSPGYYGEHNVELTLEGEGLQEAMAFDVTVDNPHEWDLDLEISFSEDHTNESDILDGYLAEGDAVTEFEDAWVFEYGDGDITEFTDVQVCADIVDATLGTQEIEADTIRDLADVNNAVRVEITDARGVSGSALVDYEIENYSNRTVVVEYNEQWSWGPKGGDLVQTEQEHYELELSPAESESFNINFIEHYDGHWTGMVEWMADICVDDVIFL